MSIQEPFCFVEFKLVPISAIHAKLDTATNEYLNPFVGKLQKGVVE